MVRITGEKSALSVLQFMEERKKKHTTLLETKKLLLYFFQLNYIKREKRKLVYKLESS